MSPPSALLLLDGGLVLAAKLFNSALEHLIDHLHPSLHTASGSPGQRHRAVSILSRNTACVCCFSS
ncbi:diacylglycerol kinase [Janthinobacterium sp. K2C7]|uniref:diacylglycerol kinase n=1 Tax=unclassified Janthinobacterium TaxID=2610881 RepID=UPI003906282F